MVTWQAILVANARGSIREQRSYLNDMLHAAWALEPRTACEVRELEQLESAVLTVTAAGRATERVAGVQSGTAAH